MNDPRDLHAWLGRFALDEFLRVHVAAVMAAMPAGVRGGLVDDPAFRICAYDPGPGGMCVTVAAPGGRGAPGRSVVLPSTLRRNRPCFALWMIAHELAHAHLRHGGRWPGEDPERAADALAAEWGFPRPW